MDPVVFLYLFVGFVLLIGGAEWLVRGAADLSIAAGLSPLVVGLTVVAFGTSAPELAVSLQAAVNDQAGLAIGNVVGSNICNVLLILGVSALITPLLVEQQLIRRDVPIMIGASLLLYYLVFDGILDRNDGFLLFSLIIIYTVYTIIQNRRSPPPACTEEKPPLASRSVVRNLVLVAIGLVLLVVGARLLVGAAVDIARHLQLSELLIGLTIVAIGTSLPELAASIVACVRGHGEIAVGNAIGSSLFNILSVLGLTALIAPTAMPVSGAVIAIDMPIMIVAAVACLPIFFTGFRIARSEGALFLAFYALYLTYLGLTAAEHESLNSFGPVMLFILPLTLVTLGVLAWRFNRDRRLGPG